MKKLSKLVIFVIVLALSAVSCGKYEREIIKSEALERTKSQKVLAIMTGGMQTIIMCKNGKVVVAQHTKSDIFGDHFKIKELQKTNCE